MTELPMAELKVYSYERTCQNVSLTRTLARRRCAGGRHSDCISVSVATATATVSTTTTRRPATVADEQDEQLRRQFIGGGAVWGFYFITSWKSKIHG